MERAGPQARPSKSRPSETNPASWLSERLRRCTLGLLGGLLVARGFWPSEGTSELESGSGLGWTLALLLVAILALAGPLIQGRLTLRRSWVDFFVLGLFLCVGLSTAHAAERRVAINLAWQWGGVALAYVLLRWLPRSREESLTLAGAIAAGAVAVSAYAFYQAGVELPSMAAAYRRDPSAMLQAAGVAGGPGSAEARSFEKRLLYSTEPYATFGLANSLAAYLVGPIVLGLATALLLFRRRDPADPTPRKPAWPALVAGAVPLVAMLVCLLLTKSRSAWLGVTIGAILLLALHWRLVSANALRAAFLASFAGLGVAIPLMLATGRLDREVFTQSPLSLKYRLEYWQGAWGVLTDGSTWWSGLGPGNFRAAYLRHKLPVASEDIADPHNLFLETWTTAGLPALLCLLLALGLAWRNLAYRVDPALPRNDSQGPRNRTTGWLLAWSGSLGWTAPVLFGHLMIFNENDNADLLRWLILGAGWGLGVLLAEPAWRRASVTAGAFGAATTGIVVALLATGGIGYAAVASMLWGLLALGLNLRDDRRCGRLVEVPGGRLGVFATAAVLVALIGVFAGAIAPHWRCQAALLHADRVLAESRGRLSSNHASAMVESLERAARADAFAVRPWLALAELEYQSWMARGASMQDSVWNRIEATLDQARKAPRNDRSLEVRRARASYARRLLLLPDLPSATARRLRLIEADARFTIAVELNPTGSVDRAEAALALGAVGETARAIEQAEIAQTLDRTTPHADRKLPDPLRARLESELDRWQRPEP